MEIPARTVTWCEPSACVKAASAAGIAATDDFPRNGPASLPD
jgi:hypothetical protein